MDEINDEGLIPLKYSRIPDIATVLSEALGTTEVSLEEMVVEMRRIRERQEGQTNSHSGNRRGLR